MITSSARRVRRHVSPAAKQSQQERWSYLRTRSFIAVEAVDKTPNQLIKIYSRGIANKDESSSLSYFERKATSKQLRVEAYKQKLERAIRFKFRRESSLKNVEKDKFRSWWDGRRAYEEQMNRKARQAGMDWTIQVATIVERLPVVLLDKEPFETEFDDLQAYLKAHRGKKCPKEFLDNDGSSRPEAYTDEELIALLPANFQPAPRETKADKDGSLHTLERRLTDRVYLMIDGSFPTTIVKWSMNEGESNGDECEDLLLASLRGLREHVSRFSLKKKDRLSLGLYSPSRAPIGVKLDVYDEDQQKLSGSYGTKTFFVKIQYDDGKLDGDGIVWLDRSEIIERFHADSKNDDAMFFRYLL